MTPEEALGFRDSLISWGLKASPSDPSQHMDAAVGMHAILRSATIGRLVLWEPSLKQAAESGCEAFVGRNWDCRATEPQIWVHERLPISKWILSEHDEHELEELSEYDHVGTVICQADYRGKGDSLLSVALLQDRVARRYPKFLPLLIGFDGRSFVEARHAWIRASLEFLEQEFVGVESPRWSKELRRAAEQKQRPPLPEINVVTLRRSAREEKSHGYQGSPRDYSCQWLVGAHWRKQLCRKRDENGEKTKDGAWEVRPVYVPAHVKGPEDKPLRQPKGTVYRVNR